MLILIKKKGSKSQKTRESLFIFYLSRADFLSISRIFWTKKFPNSHFRLKQFYKKKVKKANKKFELLEKNYWIFFVKFGFRIQNSNELNF